MEMFLLGLVLGITIGTAIGATFIAMTVAAKRGDALTARALELEQYEASLVPRDEGDHDFRRRNGEGYRK